MISEQSVIDLINADTSFSYPITLAEDIVPNLGNAIEIPEIYLMHSRVTSRTPNSPFENSIVHANGENLTQQIQIHIVSPRDIFREAWINVFKSLTGKNPYPDQAHYTTLSYVEGGRMGISFDNIWHVDIWHIGFPTRYPLG